MSTAPVQLTVRRFDDAARSGQAVHDDGRAVELPAGCLDPQVRGLRPGQRLDALLQDGTVVAATLTPLPLVPPGTDGPPPGAR